MAFAIYLHRDNFQPEDPLILDKNIQGVNGSNVNFTFVDFVPSVIKRSGTVIPQCEVRYHSFSQMIETANYWLQRNTEWEVVNCETVILLYKYNDNGNFNELRPNDCCFYIYGSEKNNVLKALRVWIKRRPLNAKNGIYESQVLSYMDIIPEHKDEMDCSANKFENLDEVIARTNELIKTGGIEGKIITIESLQIDATNDWKIDTEISLSQLSSKNVFILRIFYELGQPSCEEIGIADFSPKLLSRGTFFKRPKFEPFDKVIERASQWLTENPAINFRNAQSIDIKMKSVSQANTRLMAFTEHGDYCRIFRMTYTKPTEPIEPTEPTEPAQIQPKPVYLSTKIFLPYKKSDTIMDIKQRLSDWVNQYLDLYSTQSDSSNDTESGQKFCSRLLSAETVEVFAKDFRDDNVVELEKAALEDTFLANRFGNKNAYMFFSLRIFFDSSKPNERTKSDSSSSESIPGIEDPDDSKN